MYHDTPSDRKLRVVADRTDQPMAFVVAVWVCLLDTASKHDPRGFAEADPEEIAVDQGIKLEHVHAIIQTFVDKGMIDDASYLTAWNKRQHTTSTERVKKYRDKKKQDETDGNAEKRDVTKGNARKRKNSKKSPDTDTEQITDTDLEADTKTDSNTKKEAEGEFERKIARQMLDIWNAEVQSKLTPDYKARFRKERIPDMKARWLDDFKQDIKAWQYYCEIIANSEFLLGKKDGKPWTIHIKWAVESSENVDKILEGRFSDGKHPSKLPSCEIAELEQAWDYVIGKLETKHSKAIIRCWFTRVSPIQIRQSAKGAIVVLQAGSAFLKQRIEQDYLAELQAAFAEQPHYQPTITKVELTTKEPS